MKNVFAIVFCVGQKLEEAAANAAEEERRRLQTQNELQDLYRVEMEKEKMVLVCFSSGLGGYFSC